MARIRAPVADLNETMMHLPVMVLGVVAGSEPAVAAIKRLTRACGQLRSDLSFEIAGLGRMCACGCVADRLYLPKQHGHEVPAQPGVGLAREGQVHLDHMPKGAKLNASFSIVAQHGQWYS